MGARARGVEVALGEELEEVRREREIDVRKPAYADERVAKLQPQRVVLGRVEVRHRPEHHLRCRARVTALRAALWAEGR